MARGLVTTASRRARGVRTGAILSAAGALAALSGCTDLFGFDRLSATVECIQDQDCAGKLGSSCIDNQCTDPASSAPVDSSGASTAEGGASGGDASDPSPSDSGCVNACPPFSLCLQSHCLPVDDYGDKASSDASQFLIGGNIQGIRVSIDACGFVTGIGFVTTVVATHTQYRFGIYEDNHGMPGDLVAQTPLGIASSGENDVLVDVPAPVDCPPGGTTPYWLLGVWQGDADPDFAAEPTLAQFTISAQLDLPVSDVLQTGLPATFPAPGHPIATPILAPHIFAIVAQDQ